MIRHRIAGLATACALLAGSALATATSASATTDPTGAWDYTVSTTVAGGTLFVRTHGDVVMLCDEKADGLAPRAEVEFWNGADWTEVYTLTASDGYGSCVTAQASDGGKHNLLEAETYEGLIWLGPNGPRASGAYDNWVIWYNNS